MFDKKFLHFLINSEHIIFYFRYSLTLILNCFLVFYLEYEHNNSEILEESFKDINNSFSLILHHKIRFFIYLVLSILIYFFMILEILICFYNKKVQIQKKPKESKSILQKIKFFLGYFNFDNLFFFLLNLIAFFIPWIWSIVLLDILTKSPTMRDIIRSVTLNYKQLLKTVLLMIIILYIYSFVAFSYFP